MNELGPIRTNALFVLFDEGLGVRAAARELGISKDTSTKYREKWIKENLQRAYDLLWDGDCEGCDKITAKLPEDRVIAMLNCWSQDWENDYDHRRGKPGVKMSEWY
jgi:hypothetical protein